MPTAVEYKYVILHPNGSVREWCKGANRKLVPADLMCQTILVSETWDEVSATCTTLHSSNQLRTYAYIL